ncbi:DNA methyltransferase [Candidatus Roizmanbacteria bacterium RIFCSPHIGHO2_02_FULL_40_13b]|uniref:DNA methyltransferase n=1 Tax=Candidatus Roizmanbacteria bacterium RIFCSPHIGHO2_01_FULL_39_24 TaxID=1802032 RepID=A0A1F7GEF0_9BACT|nr:MAG: DNA methyltransferase [Candidatus Roizmanbacteria bacterium RIFCSPHIGHO2_01_FULL_39_24]OGK26219.1 MAG: DNA methyltransferase [Candidatus Roizmanbacteria bacterium RIFCSPHIGHO2_02_FULL_40_13b]OGK50371.1 MAG: DNA methyltransferase [Candidatus Roizmanbacteria bacterium RIFCSPLOWO2_01_FULL_40_32]
MDPKLKSKIMKKLEAVLDPELYVSIVDLGLIYDILDTKGKITVTMTLTTMGCPLFGLLEEDIKSNVMKIKGVRDVFINLVFDPPWSMDRMTERGKAQLGI